MPFLHILSCNLLDVLLIILLILSGDYEILSFIFFNIKSAKKIPVKSNKRMCVIGRKGPWKWDNTNIKVLFFVHFTTIVRTIEQKTCRWCYRSIYTRKIAKTALFAKVRGYAYFLCVPLFLYNIHSSCFFNYAETKSKNKWCKVISCPSNILKWMLL